MAEFKCEVLTPKRQFFSGMVEAVTCTLADGEMTIWKDHAPLLAALEIGELRFKQNGTWQTVYAAEGFIEVRPDEVLIFTQGCERPEDIDEARAEEEREQAMEKLRQKQSLVEYHQTQIALSRAMAMLRIKRGHR
ncbi:MAG: ATP synthase F1 subunit epsilon [Ruminococcaceae bacterium]|nr:ATP synthase F1 subunit epsilon [Oscillospiraceae bacterium]